MIMKNNIQQTLKRSLVRNKCPMKVRGNATYFPNTYYYEDLLVKFVHNVTDVSLQKLIKFILYSNAISDCMKITNRGYVREL